jgi:hypothetical protein
LNMCGPQLVRELENGWTLRRWEYDGAPLELHGPGGVMITMSSEGLELELEYTKYGCYSSYQSTMYKTVPADAMRALLEGR